MYEEGKIWVVIAIIGIIFLGITIFLVFIDRKLRKLEKHFEDTASVSEEDKIKK